MFHRPKTEEQSENQNVNQDNKAEGKTMSENNTQEKNEDSNDRSIGIPGSGLSRVGATGARPNVPGNYSGYVGTPSYNPNAVGTNSQFDNGRKLIVGQGISMSGEIDSCDHLIVEGKVEAALRGAKLLDITENGTFFGTVEIEEANVAGTFEGDLTVKGRLTIKSGGSITGEISYGELAIEAGALIDGTLRPLNAEKKDKKTAPKTSNAPAKSHQQQSQKVPQDQTKGGELPFSDDKKVAAAE